MRQEASLHGNVEAKARTDTTTEMKIDEATAGDPAGTLLLMDFGLSLRQPCDTAGRVGAAERKVWPWAIPRGTVQYMSPEVFANAGPYDAYSSDMWSVGMCFFIMLLGFPAVELGPTAADARWHVLREDDGVRKLLRMWKRRFSNEAEDLLTKMLTVDPEQRITAAQALQHPFIVA